MQVSILKTELFDENKNLIKNNIRINSFNKEETRKHLEKYTELVKKSNIDNIQIENKNSITNIFFCIDINVFIENKREEHNCVFLNIDCFEKPSIDFFYAQKHKNFDLKSNLIYSYNDKKYIFIDLNSSSYNISSHFNLMKNSFDLNSDTINCIYQLSKNGKISHISKILKVESFYLKNSLNASEDLKKISKEIIERKQDINEYDHRGIEFSAAFHQNKNLKFDEKCIKIEDDDSSLIIPFKNIPFYQCRKKITYTTVLDIPNIKEKKADLNFYEAPIYLVDIEINNFKKTLYLFEYQYEKFKKLYLNNAVYEKRPIITL